ILSNPLLDHAVERGGKRAWWMLRPARGPRVRLLRASGGPRLDRRYAYAGFRRDPRLVDDCLQFRDLPAAFDFLASPLQIVAVLVSTAGHTQSGVRQDEARRALSAAHAARLLIGATKS